MLSGVIVQDSGGDFFFLTSLLLLCFNIPHAFTACKFFLFSPKFDPTSRKNLIEDIKMNENLSGRNFIMTSFRILKRKVENEQGWLKMNFKKVNLNGLSLLLWNGVKF